MSNISVTFSVKYDWYGNVLTPPYTILVDAVDADRLIRDGIDLALNDEHTSVKLYTRLGLRVQAGEASFAEYLTGIRGNRRYKGAGNDYRRSAFPKSKPDLADVVQSVRKGTDHDLGDVKAAFNARDALRASPPPSQFNDDEVLDVEFISEPGLSDQEKIAKLAELEDVYQDNLDLLEDLLDLIDLKLAALDAAYLQSAVDILRS